MVAPLPILKFYLVQDRTCGKPPNEVLGNHRRQSQESRLEFGLGLSRGFQGRTIWIADAHRDDGKRFIVRADEKLAAFVELESAIRAAEPLAAAVG